MVIYANLKAEIARKGINNTQIAAAVGVTEKSIKNKLSGTTAFTLPEAEKIKSVFFPTMSLDELFKSYDTPAPVSQTEDIRIAAAPAT